MTGEGTDDGLAPHGPRSGRLRRLGREIVVLAVAPAPFTTSLKYYCALQRNSAELPPVFPASSRCTAQPLFVSNVGETAPSQPEPKAEQGFDRRVGTRRIRSRKGANRGAGLEVLPEVRSHTGCTRLEGP